MDTHSYNRTKTHEGNVGRWVFWGFALVAGYFLFTEHRAHMFAVLPYLLLAACPLMHFFHHGRHGHHHQPAGDEGPGPQREPGASGVTPPDIDR